MPSSAHTAIIDASITSWVSWILLHVLCVTFSKTLTLLFFSIFLLQKIARIFSTQVSSAFYKNRLIFHDILCSKMFISFMKLKKWLNILLKIFCCKHCKILKVCYRWMTCLIFLIKALFQVCSTQIFISIKT